MELTLKELDWELIRDITLFKQNDISHLSHIVYDIKIKGVNTDDGHILVYYDMWNVEHKNNLTMFGGQSNSVKSATVTIDWSEYLVLVRQKKLKELGI
jgi:hypothetical protein